MSNADTADKIFVGKGEMPALRGIRRRKAMDGDRAISNEFGLELLRKLRGGEGGHGQIPR